MTALLRDLARAKAVFQQRAIVAHLGVNTDAARCASCGKPVCGCPDAKYAGLIA